MHPDTYVFLAGERIADLHREADRRRLTSRATGGGRPTIHRREPSASAAVPRATATRIGHRGAG